MKGRDKDRGPRLLTCLSKHRDGWRWEPAMHLPSRWRRRELRYDGAQPSMWGSGAA